MKNDNVKSVVVLFACCLTVAVLLAAINLVTAPIIEENDRIAILNSLESLIVNADFEQISTDGLPSSVTNAFVDKNGGGYALIFTAKSQYSSSPMQFSVGISKDGKITAIKQITYMESKSFGNYPERFIGADQSTSAEAEVFAGVTYSSNAFKSALNDVFDAFNIITEQEEKNQ